MIQPCQCLEFFRCVWLNSRHVGLNKPPILASIADLDTSANLRELGAWKIPLIRRTFRFRNHNNEWASRIKYEPPTCLPDTFQARLELHPPRRALLFPGTFRFASCLTPCYFVALFSRYSIKLHTIFTLIHFPLHSQLHFIKHGTYGQPGEESLFTEEPRSTPWESTCTCIAEDSQSSLPIKCLNIQPSLWV